jgi:hypothetical protein
VWKALSPSRCVTFVTDMKSRLLCNATM